MQPDEDPILDVSEREVSEERADGEQDRTEDQVGGPAGGRPQHDDEDPEEEQRGAEVLLDEEHGEGYHPGHQEWTQVARLWEPERSQPARGHGQELLSSREI